MGMFGVQPPLDPDVKDLNQAIKDGNFKAFIALLAQKDDRVNKQHVVDHQLN